MRVLGRTRTLLGSAAAALTLLTVLCALLGPPTPPSPVLCDFSAPSGGLGDRLLSAFAACAEAARLDERRAAAACNSSVAGAACAVLQPTRVRLAWRHSWKPGRGLTYAVLHVPRVHAEYLLRPLRHGSAGMRGCTASVPWDELPGWLSHSPEWGREGGNAAAWRACARSTRLARPLRALVPAHALADVTGVHLRRSDKMRIGVVPGPYEQTAEEWRLCAVRALRHAEALIAAGHTRFMVVGDEPDTAVLFGAALRAAGGELVDSRTYVRGALARAADALARAAHLDNVLDMWRLAACARIMQVAKYSSFSVTAAALGGTPLLNFYGDNGDARFGIAYVAPLLQNVTFVTPPVEPEALQRPVVGEHDAGNLGGCSPDDLFCDHRRPRAPRRGGAGGG